MKALQQFIHNLSVRERMVLGTGLVATIGLLSYALLLDPWYRELARLRDAVPQKTSDLAWMKSRVADAERLRRNADSKRNKNTNVLSVVEKTAEQSKVPIRQINPGPEGEVKIWFREMDFDPWLRWLENLRKQGIEVTAASVDQTADNKVNIRLTVKKGI